MDPFKPTTLRKVKTQASRLLKELKSNADTAHQAANRFIQLPAFSKKPVSWLTNNVQSVQLKHAYQVIAYESGFKSWPELKQAIIRNDCLYRASGIAFIHSWFTRYSDAEIYFKKHGGYLISFWKDYVVCGKEYIALLGLDTYNDLWKSIGNNWVKPEDHKAFQRLQEVAAENYEAAQSL